ncbi:hypothetical protein P152DRAFT_376787, partial [Eremomyces bilateralis CBS 781.70]
AANASTGSQGAANGGSPSTYFEQQRAILVGEISQSLEHTLQNLNKLNLSLESVIQVGNELGSVEALWSQFENFMGKEEQREDQADETAVKEEEE